MISTPDSACQVPTRVAAAWYRVRVCIRAVRDFTPDVRVKLLELAVGS